MNEDKLKELVGNFKQKNVEVKYFEIMRIIMDVLL